MSGFWRKRQQVAPDVRKYIPKKKKNIKKLKTSNLRIIYSILSSVIGVGGGWWWLGFLYSNSYHQFISNRYRVIIPVVWKWIQYRIHIFEHKYTNKYMKKDWKKKINYNVNDDVQIIITFNTKILEL